MVDVSFVGVVDDADDNNDADGSVVWKTVEASSTGRVDDDDDDADADADANASAADDADGSVIFGIVQAATMWWIVQYVRTSSVKVLNDLLHGSDYDLRFTIVIN